MYSNSRNYNELSDYECAVWCKLNPDIDPSQWAYLCRCLGNLSPREFSQISYHIRRKRVISLLKRQVLNLLSNIGKKSKTVPLISIGPSGVSGEYQREVE